MSEGFFVNDMPRLQSFGDDHTAETAESWILREKAGRERVLTVDRGSEVLNAQIVNWRRFECSGEGWNVVVSAERTVETLDIEVVIDGQHTSFIQNFRTGAYPKDLLVLRPEGARIAYVFPEATVVFREPWRDSESGKNIRALIEFRPSSATETQRVYLMLASILYWTNLPYDSNPG